MSSNAPQHASYAYDVFLSHATADKAFVEALALRLKHNERLRPFLDKWNLVPGRPWQEEIETALDASATCAVFVGRDGVSPWANEEMRAALDDRARSRMLRVFAVLLPGNDQEPAAMLPRFLRRLTWVDFRSGLDDASAYRRFVAGVRGEMPGADDGLPNYILDQLGSEDSEERRAAAAFIGDLGLPEALAIIESRYADEEDPTVRHWLSLAAGQIGSEPAVDFLQRLRTIESDRFALLGIETALKGNTP